MKTQTNTSETNTSETNNSPTMTVQEFYTSVGSGNVSRIVELLHPELDWTEAEGFPYYSGNWTKPQEVIEKLLMPIMRDWDDFSAKANEFIVQNNQVVSLGVYSGTHKVSGKRMLSPFAHVWKVEDQKLKKFNMYTDTLLINRAMEV